MQLNDKDVYEQAAELDGVKIVDSSFVKSYLARGWRELDFRERCRNLGRERKLYYVMADYSCFYTTYPDEMRMEFRSFGTNLNILYDLLGEGKEKVKGKLKLELEELYNRFMIVLSERRNLENEVLNINKTENCIEYSKGYLSYLPAIISIGSCDDVRKPHEKRLLCRKEHDLHDERIFAKALEIAKERPVYILTGDSDFIRMHEKFYKEIDLLSDIYGFKIPEYAVNIVARFKDSPLLIAEPHEELRALNEEKIYIFSFS